MKRYEKQYAASAAACSDQSGKRSDHACNVVMSLAKSESVEPEQPKHSGLGAGRQVQLVCPAGVAEGLAILGVTVPGKQKPQVIP